MSPYPKICTRVFLIAFLFVSNAAFSSQYLLIYRDFGHKGDANQAQGVIDAYSQLAKDINVKEFNIGQEDALKSTAAQLTKENPIVLAVGEKTVASFAGLLPIKGATTIHLCHMVTADHPKLLGKVNFLALPMHAVKPAFEKKAEKTTTPIIKTVGVAHNRQIKGIERVYEQDKEKLPFNPKYLGVILAGDAPTPQNKILVFTKKNARELARSVAGILGDRHLPIINGPRTGKYDPTTLQEIKTAHRDGQKDLVTQAFVDELQAAGLSPEQFTVFDFQFGKPNQDMDLVLGAIRATHSQIFVPGESTSSISECADVLPRGSVLIYPNTAMNPIHRGHVKSELEARRVQVLSSTLKEVSEQKESTDSESRSPSPSAAETVARVLYRN